MNRKPDVNGGGDSDHTFLDDVLNRLYDFGDGTQGRRKKKLLKSKKRKSNEEIEYTSADSGHATTDGVREFTTSPERNFAVENTTLAIKIPAPVEIVIFQNPSKKKKTKKTLTPVIKPPPAEEEEKKRKVDHKDLSLEKARLEVHRFGITGYQKEQQRVFEQERAIMLGATPPKKKHVNYKVYQQMMKDKKLKAKEEPKLDNKKKKNRESKERGEKRKSSSSSLPTGQVGRFKNGMLVISSKEIQRIKSSKVKK